MLLNQYDSTTGQYVHSFLADPDPRNEDRWLEPAFTTDVQLPERLRNTWPFFLNGEWVLLPDYRNVVLYRQEGGEPAEILVAGITPEQAGMTTTPRPSDLHVWGDGAWILSAEAVAQRERTTAMGEFDVRMSVAKAKNAGKADAYAAGLLDPQGIAIFKAWSSYQMDLVRVLEGPDFPAVREWPDEPSDEVIAKIAADEEAMVAARNRAVQEAIDRAAKDAGEATPPAA